MEKYLVRTKYLETLKGLKEMNLIKVMTGVRRCGKSVLMQQFQDFLRSEGVKDEQIIAINLEDVKNYDLLDFKALHNYIEQRLYKNGWTYVFLDEVQMVPEFQRTINSLRIKDKVDLYVTGSNSSLLSGELATLLTGRYMSYHMLPLSFQEYLEIVSKIPKKDWNKHSLRPHFDEYIIKGSFPQTANMKSEKHITVYLDDVYSSILRKDILGREKTVNGPVLESIAKFVFHSVGSEISPTNIANSLKSNKREASYNTVEKYLQYLKDCYLIYEIGRYDVKGKQHLKKNSKYYVVDIGLRNMLLANQQSDLGHVLENIVYLELLRRGHKISVGKIDDKEIDFVCQTDDGVEYYQVTATMLDASTRERELDPLRRVKDNHPKFVITLDDYSQGNYDGIRVINAIDFLLGDKD